MKVAILEQLFTVGRFRLPAAINVISQSVFCEQCSDDGPVELAEHFHKSESDVEIAAAMGPGVSRLAETREQFGGYNQPLGRE